jgi:hypothetical protein
MMLDGANRICFIIDPGKSDILEYYGTRPERFDAVLTDESDRVREIQVKQPNLAHPGSGVPSNCLAERCASSTACAGASG